MVMLNNKKKAKSEISRHGTHSQNVRLYFSIRRDRPNECTIAAMKEAKQIACDSTIIAYTDLNQLYMDL